MLSAMPKPEVLLFNIQRDDRCEAIERYLTGHGVTVRHIPPADFGQPIGFLLGLPGYQAAESRSFFTFSDEMLLMRGFDQAMLNDFLSFFSREKVRRIALKAMLTPSNAAWSAAELHRHLSAEQQKFAAMKK